jgi:hypothetical protein
MLVYPPWYIRIPMIERMEEAHEFPHELGHFDRFFHALLVEERSFYNILQDIQVPFRVIFCDHDLW